MNDAMARCQNMVELHPVTELALNQGQVGWLPQVEERLRELEAHSA